jgi:hypothetical protein
MKDLLVSLLQLAAIGQFLIAMLNVWLVPLLGWRDELKRMPLLVREVFQVHIWFISITLGIFATLTWFFPAELSSTSLGRWLAGAIGLFWAVRTVLQLTFYSSSHWRGSRSRTLAHMTLLLVYSGFAATYISACLEGP